MRSPPFPARRRPMRRRPRSGSTAAPPARTQPRMHAAYRATAAARSWTGPVRSTTASTMGSSRHGSSMTEERTYESAVARVEEIIRRLDSGEAGLRETLELVKEGRDLVEYCAAELEAVSEGLEELRLEELVARLESGVREK